MAANQQLGRGSKSSTRSGSFGYNPCSTRRRELIERAVAHYQLYFEERRRIAGCDAFKVFAAPWLSALERAHQWVAGIKPALIVRLAERGAPLAEEQARRLARLREETARGEREVAEVLAAVQESVAAPPLLVLLRRMGHAAGVVVGPTLDGTADQLSGALAGVVERADQLREATVRKAMEVLRPAQAVGFLAAAAEFQLSMRRWGLQRDAQSQDRETNWDLNFNTNSASENGY